MKTQLLFLFGISFLLHISVTAQHYPFPQHTDYQTHIKPDGYTQAQLDGHVRSFYDGWKNKYLINGCESDHYYVFFDSGNTVTVSEAMGYGMIIIPLMAGYDANALNYFDGLYRYYKAHPSSITPNLMAWKQITDCVNADGPDSASDGDIDIAFGLLLAHAQWGSQGEINYLQEAVLIINDMMGQDAAQGDINQDLDIVKLGDWVGSGNFMNGTRTSDFIMDHFRAFSCAATDTVWDGVVEKCYDLINDMQTNYSSATGLLPDFIDDVDALPKPADPNFLEGPNDGEYSYNACRDPWRLANDYLINGDERARAAVVKINQWLLESTGGSANNVYAGYHLDGTRLNGWSDISFTAPFTVGAMVDTANQEWLNALYSKILLSNIANGAYYDNTLKLLSLITLSGNYWVPPCEILNGTDDLSNNNRPSFQVFPTSSTGNLILKIDQDFKNEKLIVKVFNSWSTLVFKESFQYASHFGINIGSCPKGMYLVSLITAKGIFLGTQKVVKQ